MATQPTQRNKELAAIHAAKRELQMDDDAYRAMLWSVARVHSAADLDSAGRQRVLDHLRNVGWSNKPIKRVGRRPGKPHNLDHNEMLQKIEAQLTELKAPWSYADTIAKRQTGIERVAWLRKTKQLQGVITALAVEQEKRALLQAVDDELARQGMTRDDLTRYGLMLGRGWKRNRRTLAAVLEYLQEREG